MSTNAVATGSGKVTADALMNMVGEKDLDMLKSLGAARGIVSNLGVDPAVGIRSSEQAERQERFGENRIPQKPQKTYLAFLWDVFQDLTIYFLVAAAIVSIVLWAAVEDHEEEPHGWIEGVAITITVLLVLNLGAWQDWKKQREFMKLNAEVANVKVPVLRDGNPVEISKYDLVVGDIVRLHVGDILEGDGVLLHGSDVECDESALTGEPLLIKKNPTAPFFISGSSIQKGQGVYVVVAVGVKSQCGKIQALVRGVAKKGDGEDEKNDTEDEAAGSPLQGKLEKVAILIGKVAAIIAVLAFIGMATRFCIKTYAIDDKPWDKSHGKEMLGWVTTTIAVFVVAIPEGLPLAVTLALSLSISKMLKLNNMVKHLDSTETMGSTTTICSDKTGTLTQNRMTVVRAQVGPCAVIPGPNETCGQSLKKACTDPLLLELLASNICLNRAEAEIEWDQKANRWTQIGNKTDCALLACAHDLGFAYKEVRAKEEFFTTQESDGQRVLGAKLYPFSSARKRAGIVVPNGDGYRLYVKGAPEMVFALCSESYGGEDFNKEHALQLTSSYSKDALRNIAFAYRDFPSVPPWDIMLSEKDAIRLTGQPAETYQIESNLIFYALVGIEDPVRPSVPPAIIKCNTAGVDVRMVTGDNLETAIAIAKQCGIIRPGIDIVDDKLRHKSMAMTGPDFRKAVLDDSGTINQEAFDLIWPQLRVLARSSPTDKHTLVTGISCSMLYNTDVGRQLKIYPDKQVVAVTGDGTNDAPALKRADVGFAMGITGTSVAKDAADIILLDDDFASIVTACLWGRNVYDSIAKFLQFQLTVNVSAVTLVCVGAFAFSRSPLSIVQMLWVNVIMDSLGALSLASEPPDEKLLLRPPYGRNASVLSSYMTANILGQSLYQLTIVFLILFAGAGDSDIDTKFKDRTEGGIFKVKSANSLSSDDHVISMHYSFIFNTFVLMQFGNWINARKLYHEWNVFEGIHRNWMFLGIWFFCMFLQVVLVEIIALVNNDRKDCDNEAVKVTCLTPTLWGLSCAFGAGAILWQLVIIFMYKLLFPKSRPTDLVITKSYTITAAAGDDNVGGESGNLRGILSEQSVISVISSGLPGARNPRRQHDFEHMNSARRSRLTLTNPAADVSTPVAEV